MGMQGNMGGPMNEPQGTGELPKLVRGMNPERARQLGLI